MELQAHFNSNSVYKLSHHIVDTSQNYCHSIYSKKAATAIKAPRTLRADAPFDMAPPVKGVAPVGLGPMLPVLPGKPELAAAPDPKPDPEPEPDPDPDPEPDPELKPEPEPELEPEPEPKPEPVLDVPLLDPNPPEEEPVLLATAPLPVAEATPELTAVAEWDEEEAEEEVVLDEYISKLSRHTTQVNIIATYWVLQLRSYKGVVLCALMTPKLGLGVVVSASCRVYQ